MKEDETIRSKLQAASITGNYNQDTYENMVDEWIESINELNEEKEDLVVTVYETVNGITSCSISFDNYIGRLDVSKSSILLTMYEVEENKTENEFFTLEINKIIDENSAIYKINLSGNDLSNLHGTEYAGEARNLQVLANVEYEISGINEEMAGEKLTFVMNQSDTRGTMAVGVEYKNNISFKESSDITELTNSNSVILNDLSRDTLAQTIEQLIERIAELHTMKLQQAQQNSESTINKLIELIQEQGTMLENIGINTDNPNNTNTVNNEIN